MAKHRLSGDGETREVYLDGKYLDPKPSIKIRNHSPDGFNWGYGGSGPAQLALAVMLKLTGKSDGYQDFKFKTIAAIPIGQDFDIEFELASEDTRDNPLIGEHDNWIHDVDMGAK